MDLGAIYSEFIKLHQERQSDAKVHEESNSFEMSYISYWSILEDGLKLFATLGTRAELHSKIRRWNDFLSGKTKTKPKDIRNFSTEYNQDKIPRIELIELVLGSMPSVAKIIEPNKKWRNRRNDIAHKASKFKNESLYLEYKADILEAIGELNKNITITCTRTK